MPAWNELVEAFATIPDDQKGQWLTSNLIDYLQQVSARRDGRNVLFYASAFLQKPQLGGALTQITHEEINGFMTAVHGMTVDSGLTLIIHTPGGVTNAAETLINYLHSKFSDIETIIPTYAMSAGTMISLGTNRIYMGRQSQLGPIDPQLPLGNRFVSARAIVDQFKRAQEEIDANPRLGHLWAPILQSLGPALLTESENALAYGERMVAAWLEKVMFGGDQNARTKAEAVARHFNDATQHKSHGRRINRTEARAQGIVILDLEDSQDLQDAVLSAYHLASIWFDGSPAAKAILTNHGKAWIKNVGTN